MSKVGKIISSHRANAGLAVVVVLLGALFLGCALLLVSVLEKVQLEGRSLVLGTAVGGALIGAGLLALGWRLRQGNRFLLGEHGVRVESKGGASEYRFDEMVETCQFYRHGVSVGIAFRTEPEGRWESVSGHLSSYSKFRNGLMGAFINARLPLLLHELAADRTLSFKRGSALEAAMSTGIHSYVNVETDAVFLSRHVLVVDETRVDVSGIAAMERGTWLQNVNLTLADGSKVALKLTNLFEPELLLAVLDATATGRGR